MKDWATISLVKLEFRQELAGADNCRQVPLVGLSRRQHGFESRWGYKINDEPHSGVQGERVGHPGLVDDHQAGPADAQSQSGRSLWWMDQVSFAKVSASRTLRTSASAATKAQDPASNGRVRPRPDRRGL
jgi:hypothetical protein